MSILMRLPWRLWLIAVVAASWLTAEVTGLSGISDTSVYHYLTGLLLAIGLFGSTYGISLRDAREHIGVILAAVTIGVLLKATIIGGVLFWLRGDPMFLLLGVAVAQIDPLAVAVILGDRRMSQRAKTILASWASFDDPLTVILVVYAIAFASGTFGLDSSSGATPGGVAEGGAAYLVTLAANLAFAALAILLWRVLRQRSPVLLTAVLVLLGALAVWQFLMLGVAIAGLAVRPTWLAQAIERITFAALFAAAVLLGLLLVRGVEVVDGALLGVMAFVAQIVVALLLTTRLSRTEKWHLALAQQNGITAIILGLRLEADYRGAVAVIAPAILVTNTIHSVANWLLDRWTAPVEPAEVPAPAETEHG